MSEISKAGASSRERAALQLWDDLTIQIADVRAVLKWLEGREAALATRIQREKTHGKRFDLRRQLRALISARYYNEVALLAFENNREFALLRGQQEGVSPQ
jgi:uncharacterized protein with von Willebrand factor type A (vWA) domain